MHRKERLGLLQKQAPVSDGKDTEQGFVNMGFEDEKKAGDLLTTGDVFLRASWREKRYSGNNNNFNSSHLAPLPSSLEVPPK